MPIGQEQENQPMFRYLVDHSTDYTKQGFISGLYVAISLRGIRA